MSGEDFFGTAVVKQNTPVVSLTFLKFVRILNASVLDSIILSEHLYINKLRHGHLFTDWGDVLFTDCHFKELNKDVFT